MSEHQTAINAPLTELREALIDVRVSELRVLAAQTAVDCSRARQSFRLSAAARSALRQMLASRRQIRRRG